MRAAIGAAALALASAAPAQDLRGSVLDSATRRPVVGAVVMYLDSAGETIARGMTNELGEFRAHRSATMRQVRVIRMGYTPRDLRLPPASAGAAALAIAIAMVPLATLLAPVSAVASTQCLPRPDRARALALYQLARDGLLATIVSREQNPGRIRNLMFDRSSEGNGQRVKEQTVRFREGVAQTSFAAVRSATQFRTQGFIKDSAGKRRYYGPDAEVLLDPEFVAGYCFRVDSDRARRREMGLGFFAAGTRPPNRVDVDGTLWVDTSARVIRGFHFVYVGVPQPSRQFRMGGRLSFAEMPNGALMIDSWSFRMVDPRPAYATGNADFGMRREWFDMHESGGQVADVTWPDGKRWDASLGTVRITVVDQDGRPSTRSALRLAGTDYAAGVDSAGVATFTQVLPGPYVVEILDSALVAKNVVIGTKLRFHLEPGRPARLTLTAPPVDEFLRRACVTNMNDFWITVQLVRPGERGRLRPVGGVEWEIGEHLGTPGEHSIARGWTRGDGRFGFCHERTHTGALQIRVRVGGDRPRVHVLGVSHLFDKEVRLELPADPPEDA